MWVHNRQEMRMKWKDRQRIEDGVIWMLYVVVFLFFFNVIGALFF